MMPIVRTCHPRSPRPRAPLALAGLLALTGTAGAAGVASAATLTTDARCYLQGAPLRIDASGLTPQAPLTVTLDGRALGYRNGATPVADASGAFASSFATPSLASGVFQRRHVLVVSDGAHSPRARFTVTRPTGADFQPATGDPRTLRARFDVWGFALGGGPRRLRVWIHWIDPAGKVRANAALGVTSGACGALTSAPRPVLPLDPRPGRWVLVLDAHRRYRVHASGPRAKIPVHVRSLSP
jgi:hypothetical protein